MFGGCLCLQSRDEDVCVLDYCHQSLDDVPTDVFSHERTLETLMLSSNQICDLPVPLFHCHTLKHLYLNDNELRALPPAFASLIHLTLLDVSRNAISSIPDNINGCKQLSTVDASVNPLVRLPDGFTQLLSLQELYLNDTFLEYLPGNFGRLSRLRVLELRENRLTALPKSMCRLTQLERLDLGQNDFSDLPSVVSSLTSLLELLCDNNKLSVIPASFGQLTSLQHLDFSNNRLSQLPEELGRCQQLVYLELSANLLQRLPESCGSLARLVTFKAFDNTLTQLPAELCGLLQLQELDVSHNVVSRLPASVGLLRQLQLLNLDDNLLTSLPPEVGSCKSLRILSARQNLLSQLPAELGHLQQLCVLNVCSNRLLNLPCSLAKLHSLQALWLSENQNKPLVPLQTETDARLGHKVLVCYMLPQSNHTPNDSDGWNGSMRRADGGRREKSRPRISFSLEGREPRCPRGSLMRAPTPYPKELKALAKHSRHLTQLLNAKAKREAVVSSSQPLSSDAPASVTSTASDSTPPLCTPSCSTQEQAVGGGESTRAEDPSVTSSHPLATPSHHTSSTAMTRSVPTFSTPANHNTSSDHVISSTANHTPFSNGRTNHSTSLDHVIVSTANHTLFSNGRTNHNTSLDHVNVTTANHTPFNNGRTNHHSGTFPAIYRSTANQVQSNTHVSAASANQHRLVVPPPLAGSGVSTPLQSPLVRPPAPPPYHVAAAGRPVPTGMTPVFSAPGSSRGSFCVRMQRSRPEWNGHAIAGARDARSSLPPDLRVKEGSAVLSTSTWTRVDVTITKSPGLGFSIAGGNSTRSQTYISRVNAGGPARDLLQVGDRLVAVNGDDITRSDHSHAVSLLMQSAQHVRLTVLRQRAPPNGV